MDLKAFLQKMDPVTKILLVLLIVFLTYFTGIFLLEPVIMQETLPSHSTIMGDHIMNFSSPQQQQLNIIAIILALVIGISVSFLIRSSAGREEGKETPPSKTDELRIIKKALSADERRVLEEVEKAGEITQDSLRFRLEWSKAKVSAILLTLDKMDLIQRERQGKTYNVFVKK